MSEEEKLQLENECLLKYSKAQMIQKYIDELEENCTLSDLWCKSQEENKRLNNIMNDIETYIHLWNIEDIGEKTMLILNDILLIKNGMRNEVVRLKEK